MDYAPDEQSPRSAGLRLLSERAQILTEIEQTEFCCRAIKWGTRTPCVSREAYTRRQVVVTHPRGLLRNRPPPHSGDRSRDRDAAHAWTLRHRDLHAEAKRGHSARKDRAVPHYMVQCVNAKASAGPQLSAAPCISAGVSNLCSLAPQFLLEGLVLGLVYAMIKNDSLSSDSIQVAGCDITDIEEYRKCAGGVQIDVGMVNKEHVQGNSGKVLLWIAGIWFVIRTGTWLLSRVAVLEVYSDGCPEEDAWIYFPGE